MMKRFKIAIERGPTIGKVFLAPGLCDRPGSSVGAGTICRRIHGHEKETLYCIRCRAIQSFGPKRRIFLWRRHHFGLTGCFISHRDNGAVLGLLIGSFYESH
jgi:hypothetical protein